MAETLYDLNKKRFQVHGLEDKIVKGAVHPKFIYRFNKIPIQILTGFLKETDKHLKFI